MSFSRIGTSFLPYYDYANASALKWIQEEAMPSIHVRLTRKSSSNSARSAR
jgi:hypothetical protein